MVQGLSTILKAIFIDGNMAYFPKVYKIQLLNSAVLRTKWNTSVHNLLQT